MRPCPACSVTRCEFGDEGIEEFRPGFLGCGDLGFQLVNKGQEFVHLGDDATLFSEGRNWKLKHAKIAKV